RADILPLLARRSSWRRLPLRRRVVAADHVHRKEPAHGAVEPYHDESRECVYSPRSCPPMCLDRSSIHAFIIHDSKISVKIYGYCLSMVFTALLGAYCS